MSRAEVERFALERKIPAAVVGYDLTFSVPKSVSILWARADASGQAKIVAAIDKAVAVGMGYIEEQAAWVGRGKHRRRAPGLVAADYVHATSRALDPQLHHHVVVANMAESPSGRCVALDGRPLYAHAKTAGYLAAADLRHELAINHGGGVGHGGARPGRRRRRWRAGHRRDEQAVGGDQRVRRTAGARLTGRPPDRQLRHPGGQGPRRRSRGPAPVLAAPPGRGRLRRPGRCRLLRPPGRVRCWSPTRTATSCSAAWAASGASPRWLPPSIAATSCSSWPSGPATASTRLRSPTWPTSG